MIAEIDVKVWCVGSSIIKHAFTEALCRAGGTNLGLERLGISIWWQGYSGLKFLHLKSKLHLLREIKAAPDFLVMHAGGNDIGLKRIPLYELIEIACDHLEIIKQRFPNSVLVWSQILPRKTWRYSQDVEAMTRSRVRVNRAVALKVLALGGCYIKYPDLLKDINLFLRPDGVHLTELGYKPFLHNIQGRLEYFDLNMGRVYLNEF